MTEKTSGPVGVEKIFGKFLDPEVVADLIRNPDKLRVSAESRDMTALCLTLGNLSQISQETPAKSYFELLAFYLRGVTEAVMRNGGTIDKYFDDTLMAFWGAPRPDPRHRARACAAALECQLVIDDLNARLGAKVSSRSGLNSGEMAVGLIGADLRLQYTVVGWEVTLAGLLESANKFFGSRSLVSERSMFGAADEVEGRLLGSVRVVGAREASKVYELLGRKGALSPEWRAALPHFAEGVRLFHAGEFAKARDRFSETLKVIPGDKASLLYVGLCADFSEIPPMGEWSVFNLTSR